MQLIPLTEEEIARRDAIDGAFSIDDAVPIHGSAAETALRIYVNNPHSNLGRIDLNVGDDELVENHTVPREESVDLGATDLPAGEHTLSVKWMTPEGFSFVEVGFVLSHEQQTLVIDAWDPWYPPRVLLDDIWLNRPLGVQYTQTKDLAYTVAPETDVLVFHNDFGRAESSALKKLHDRASITKIDEVLGVDLDLWIDGGRPCFPNPDPAHYFGRVYDAQSLSPGLHHVRVADRMRHRIIVDTQIVCNGFDWIGIEVNDDTGEDLIVSIRKGADQVYTAPISSLAFVEGLTVTSELFFKLKVDGHDLPPGLGNWLDELKRKRHVARRIRENYRKFLELRRSVKRKMAAGEKLTAEEQKAADVKNSKDLTAWVVARKKAEGIELGVAGSTALDGTVTVKKKKGPKTPLDDFDEYHTEFVHEASHVRQLHAAAKKAGLDLKKFKRWMTLERRFAASQRAKKEGKKPADELTFEELIELIKLREWIEKDPAGKAYLEEAGKLETIAQDEVDEYAGDLEMYDKIIHLLESLEAGIMMGPTLVRTTTGEEQEVLIRQNPDAPPRIRVIRGADNIEPPTVERVGPGHTSGWGRYRVKVKGKAAGRAVIEVICGDKRSVIRVSVR